jgi:membrane associated rhomboid family serine protease
MRQASVGFQCPECAGGSKAAGSPVLTGRDLRRRETPWVTNALIALNVAVFLWQLVSGTGIAGSEVSDVEIDFALLGFGVTPDSLLVGVAEGEWYRVVSGAFLHGGLIHLAMNMYFLYILGPQLERALGRVEFLLVYAVSLVAGSFGALLLEPFGLTVGASGAIYGLLGAAVVLQRRRGIDPWSSGILGLLLINILLTFAIPNISIGGHLGGLAGGLLAGVVVLESIDRRQPALAYAGCAFLGAGFSYGCIWAAEQAFLTGHPVINF